jgi:hypothetical protein
MSDNPKAYREHAAECRLSAQQAVSHDVKEHFLDLALMWDRMAADLEYTQSLVHVLAEVAVAFERPRPTTSTGGTSTAA